MDLYYNIFMLELLCHELRTNMNRNSLQNYISSVNLFKFFIIYSLISIHKITKTHKIILNNFLYLFIL
jgi:hypothetical protein